MKEALSGNEAAAHAMKQINPDVVPAFPITPQTELMQKFADFVADGEVDTEMILVESEHSAMSAAVGASAAGARVMTATSANGLALMFEIVYIAASTKLPIVMTVVNRALSGPINIHCDHSDAMGCRDSGWIQIYSENAQEVYDNVIIAMKVAEDMDVRLPVMVCQDGFITSHSLDVVEMIDDAAVKNFVGDHIPVLSLLDVDNPVTYGPLDLFDYYFEHKRQQVDAMWHVKPAFKKAFEEYAKISGRKYDIIEKYFLEDAQNVIVTMSSTAGTAKVVVDELRKQGKKVGLLKIKLFRPFPYEEVLQALKDATNIAVLDRSLSFGANSPLFAEISSAIFKHSNKNIKSYVFGLGGRDINLDHIRQIFTDLDSLKETNHDITFINLRE